MKRLFHQVVVLLTLACALAGANVRGQNIFVELLTSSSAPSTAIIHAPAGFGYSAAAPVAGTYWNTLGESTTLASGTGVGTYPLDNALSLKTSTGSAASQNLSVAYVVVSATLKTEPASASGENTIQPGGVMQNAWRNYDNGAGSYFVFTVSNLPASTPYGIYLYGATTGSGQCVGLQLAAANKLSNSPTNAFTTNTNANSNGSYGSLWTVSAGTTNLMPQGTTWNTLCGQSDADGVFQFLFKGSGSAAYFNGFQIVPLSAPGLSGLTNQTVVAGNDATLSALVTGLPAASLQWRSNNVAITSATNSSLTLNNVQSSQNNTVYSLVASNIVAVLTNSMTLTVIVTPGITGLNDQAASTGTTVSMPATVSGVPTPTTYWQFNGNYLSDGPTGDGSTIAGSATSTLSITNAQVADTGTYSLIASNSAGIVTNSETLTVSGGNVAPGITGPANQTVVLGSNATFSASVSGLPVPTLQWLDQTGTPIIGATNSTLTVSNVQYSQNGFVYSLVASNSAGVVTNGATLIVWVPVSISVQPASLAVGNTQTVSFSVTASGVPAPAYQWYFKSNAIPGATATNYVIAIATPTNAGNYFVVITNRVNVTTSSVAVLTINSSLSPTSFVPANGATGICYDTPLYVTFSGPPVLATPGTGKIRIYNASNTNTPVDTLDMSQNVTLETPFAVNVQPRTIAGETFYNFPVIITSNTAAIYPHLDVLTSNQTYYVTIDDTVFTDTNGAYFTGIAATNIWSFSTKRAGPANPTNLVVAQDYSGDFATVQGAIDSVPANNTTPTVINIRNGTYTEIVEAHAKNNLLLRGQSRQGTVIAYANNGNLNANTHLEIVFKANANNISLDNLTLNDISGYGASPAEALMIESGAGRFICNNVSIESYQDTMLANQSSSQGYFNNCLVQGSVDFIWGGGNLFYTNCQICWLTSGGEGPNPSPSSSDINSNGFSFVNCTLTTSNSSIAGCLVGRTRSITNGNTVLINCLVNSNIGGWSLDALPTGNYRNWYYSCSNLTATSAITLSNGIQLASSDPNVTNASSASLWLYGWKPALSPNIISQPVGQGITNGQQITLAVGATGIPDPSYQWQLNGGNISGATSASLTLTNAGTYSAIVSNSSGVVLSSNAVVSLASGSNPVLAGINGNNVINVTAAPYNAQNDGVSTNTSAIQNAINAAALDGTTNGASGGVVEIPAGVFLCGPINLSNNVDLQIDAGAKLQMLPYGSYPGGSNPTDFISARNCKNIEISGPGTIDGQGAVWWATNNATSGGINRPKAMFAPTACNNILISGVTLQNPPNTHISFRSSAGVTCGNVTVTNLTINTPDGTPNTDGIDLSATNALIVNSYISDGDDHIAMSDNSVFNHDIVVSNCFFGTGHGCSIGSYTQGGLSNLLVINCTWSGSENGVRLKSERGRGGLVQDLNYQHLGMTNVQWPILIYSYYNYGVGTLSGAAPYMAATDAVQAVNSTTPIWQNIAFSNVTGTVTSGQPPVMIWGLPEMLISNVVLRSVSITGGTKNCEIYNSSGIQFVDCNIPESSGAKTITLYNAGLIITNGVANSTLFTFDGLTTNGIGNSLGFYNALASLSNTNVLADSLLSLEASTFTVSNNLALMPSTVFNYMLGSNAVKVAVKGNVQLGGDINISAGEGFSNGTYTVMTYTGILNGNLPMLGIVPAGYTYSLNTNTVGLVNLLVTLPAPASLVATATNLQIILQWNSVTGATGYNLKRGTSSGNYPTVLSGLTATNYLDANVSNAVNYFYAVSATGAGGESSNSLEVTATPLPSNQPTNIVAQASGSQIQLSWPQDHLGWQLQIQTNSLGSGLGTNWFTVPNSTYVNQTNIPIDPNNGSVFLRLAYP